MKIEWLLKMKMTSDKWRGHPQKTDKTFVSFFRLTEDSRFPER